MNQKPIRIAFFDVDGTLLCLGRKEMTPNTEYTLRTLQEKGVILCMATGRGVLTMPRFEAIQFDAHITFNGSYCFAGDKLILKNPLPAEDVQQILVNAAAMNRAVSITNENILAANGTDDDLEQYFNFGGESVHIAPNFEELVTQDIYQINISCTPAEYDRILAGTKNAKIAAWWDRAVDIIPATGGKGNAVRAILDYYGLTKEEAIAFGDGKNDIEMLEAVGTGVAMGNAVAEVKAIADEVCPSVEEDGIFRYFGDGGTILR